MNLRGKLDRLEARIPEPGPPFDGAAYRGKVAAFVAGHGRPHTWPPAEQRAFRAEVRRRAGGEGSP